MILDVGCGPSSIADIQIDKVLFENMKKYKWFLVDIATENFPIESNSIDEVRMESVLEHIPVSLRAFRQIDETVTGQPLMQQTLFYPRIHCMKEAYRVLKPGGILHVSVPGTYETFCQDPTHEAPQITDGWFNYFCGQWGGNKPGDFATESYGIDFQFLKISSVNDGFTLTVRLLKEEK